MSKGGGLFPVILGARRLNPPLYYLFFLQYRLNHAILLVPMLQESKGLSEKYRRNRLSPFC